MAELEEGQAADGGFSGDAFLRGIAVAVFLYALLAGWLWLSANETASLRQSHIPSKTVAVQWPVEETENVAAEEIGAAGSGGQPDIDILESGLAAAPVEGLFEDTPQGKIPVIRADGTTSFKAYRRPFDRQAASKPVVSIAIVGMGLSDQATESALHMMPPEVSFGISPYAPSPDLWSNEARARGHEVWVTLPLEPARYPRKDTGPNTILIGAPERENLGKLTWLMGRMTGYIGFIAGSQTDFLDSMGDMKPVIGNIYSHGLAFVENAAKAGTAPATLAMGANAPYAAIDVWIDEPATQDHIRAALDELEQKARAQGAAAGVIRAMPVSYQEVKRWIETMDEKGLVLAPLSAQTGM